jgi:phage portal protein BeeE
MIGFGATGGLLPGGVSGTTALGLSSVWRCLDILSNGVSQLEWYERRGNLDLPASRLVQRPQSQRTRREWVSIVVSTAALYDVCYLLKAGEDAEGVPLSLLYLQPGIIAPKDYDPYNILPPTAYTLNGREISADQLVIIHRSPQPGVFDGLGGVIQMARTTFAAAIAAESYASRYWQAGGAPTTVLETDANLDPTQAASIEDRWAQKRAMGPDHPPVLTNGLMVADVGRYFGVPTRILNAPTGDSETYATSESSNMDLVRYTLQNYIGAIEDAVTDQLPGGRRMVMDTWRLTAPSQLAFAQATQLATGGKAWLDVDEVRERIGYGPVESPDTLNPPKVAAPVGGQNAEG